MEVAFVIAMLYVDKYRPRELDELHYHPKLTEELKALVREF